MGLVDRLKRKLPTLGHDTHMPPWFPRESSVGITPLDAVEQVQQAAKALASMQNSRGIHLSPALEAYLVNPSPENWEKVRDEAQRTLDDLTSAADAVFVYDPALLSSADLLGQIKEGLTGKARILNQIIATQSPPNMLVATAYRDELANIMSLLDDNIKRLEHRLQQIS